MCFSALALDSRTAAFTGDHLRKNGRPDLRKQWIGHSSLRTTKETRAGRDCLFCQRSDPDFGRRDPLDRLVCSKLNDTAAAHMTENGYIRHRMLEIEVRLGVTEFGPLPDVVKMGARDSFKQRRRPFGKADKSD